LWPLRSGCARRSCRSWHSRVSACCPSSTCRPRRPHRSRWPSRARHPLRTRRTTPQRHTLPRRRRIIPPNRNVPRRHMQRRRRQRTRYRRAHATNLSRAIKSRRRPRHPPTDTTRTRPYAAARRRASPTRPQLTNCS
jgi:hypothetical protein